MVTCFCKRNEELCEGGEIFIKVCRYVHMHLQIETCLHDYMYDVIKSYGF